MKKYKIELTEEQMILVSNCLEDVSRFASGQWEMRFTVQEMVKGLDFDESIKRRDDTEDLLNKVKRILLPSTPDNGSKGYNGSDFIGNTYQIYRTILHCLAVENNWDNVYSSPALESGNMVQMSGNFQKEFTHEIPVEKKIKEERISFTFRRHLH